METPLLATKLFVPEPRPGLVARPRLVARLNEALTSGLALVSAPAGFGKTTVLSQWLGQSKDGAPAAWVSLDEWDNDVIRFWDYVIAAVQQFVPGAGEATRSMLRSAEPTNDIVLNALINDLTRCEHGVTIVMDDFHLITAEPVCSTVTYLIEHLPRNLHLVIATRVDPPLPLSRFRGRGIIVEIRADDLRFTDEEAATLLRRGQTALSAQDVRSLNGQTEGWAIGLRMAAISLPQSEGVRSFIDSFTGSQRYVADFLVEEVLRLQPEEARDFLLRTSVLDTLTASLCNMVARRNDSQEMLIRLERALGGFLVPLDQSRQWYRYHHLFADLLRNQLALRSSVAEVAELNLRACQWHEEQGLRADAVNYALAARDWERAVRLISTQSGRMIAAGEMGRLIKWIGAMPQDVLRAHPALNTVYAVSLLTVGSVDAAEAALNDLATMNQGDMHALGSVAALQATLAWRTGDFHRAIEQGQRALRLLPDDDTATRSRVCFVLGVSHETLTRLDEAERYLTEAHELGLRSGDFWGSIGGAAYLAQICHMRGKLSDAVALDERAIAMAGLAPAGANAR
jgi:LuxR family transcriptional regulator, maltose regulon positive regulatory protein